MYCIVTLSAYPDATVSVFLCHQASSEKLLLYLFWVQVVPSQRHESFTQHASAWRYLTLNFRQLAGDKRL